MDTFLTLDGRASLMPLPKSASLGVLLIEPATLNTRAAIESATGSWWVLETLAMANVVFLACIEHPMDGPCSTRIERSIVQVFQSLLSTDILSQHHKQNHSSHTV
jgi:hypothetical protein